MPHTKQPLLLGAHISIAGGIELAYERGESIGCTAIQIFTKSNRQWHAPKLTTETIERTLIAQKKSSIQTTIAHASYLINLGAADSTTQKKSIASLIMELQRCQELAIPHLVLHPGSRATVNETTCLNQISDSLNTILSQTPGSVKILIENMAGQGSSVCHSFEQIGYLLNQSDFKDRLGVCLDTCHAFAAGYDFTTDSGYQMMWQEFNTHIGLHNLHTIHLNDSKKECGSRIDRHEDIGKGKMGLHAFKLLINDAKLAHIPKILETPQSTLQDHARNIEVIKNLINQ